MRYKLTLLKDFPGYPAGTVFKYFKGLCRRPFNTFEEAEFMGLESAKRLGNPKEDFPVLAGVINDPEWFRKEVDYSKLTDLKCPVCGETRVELSVEPYKKRDDDVWEPEANVYVEYACGHETRRIWGRDN